jgi:isopenicillin N synthase-like dioxygenase
MPPPFESGSGAEKELKAFYRTCHETSERLLELFAMALDVRSSPSVVEMERC